MIVIFELSSLFDPVQGFIDIFNACRGFLTDLVFFLPGLLGGAVIAFILIYVIRFVLGK